MPTTYTRRYPGSRWSICFGAYQGIEKFALDELHRVVQSSLPYTVEVRQAVAQAPLEHCIAIGTPQDNPLIQQLVESHAVQLPEGAEGFEIRSLPAPWDPQHRLLVVAAHHPAGVLYGVETLAARLLATSRGAWRRLTGLPPALMEDFHITEAPRIARRGLWSWGYVIYDYRRFLDAMARLRLNMLVMWNDIPPLNASDVIETAHARGIRVVLGFPWGWGKEYDLTKPDDCALIEAEVISHYREQIEPLHPDGIYFQTLTEHNSTTLHGRSVAAITCDLVNHISATLFKITPELEIQFGVHATSIGEYYKDFQPLDPRITIIWEDAGVLPYAYLPILKDRERSFTETLDYSKNLANLRPEAVFGMVAKGWTTLDWKNEFEHHPPYLLGQRTRANLRRRLGLRSRRWRMVNLLWNRRFPKAAEFYRAILEITGGKMTILGLVEDGLLEERIQPSVALFAETLWDPREEPKTLRNRARSPHYAG